jgi:ribosomal protection tetracycline resistance protein
VYFGSALTGIGVVDVMHALRRYLPADRTSADDPLQASVFKIERSPAGHAVAIARIFAGSLAPRDHVTYHHRSAAGTHLTREGRTTSVMTYADGTTTVPSTAKAGDIAKIMGLPAIEIGDQLGEWEPARGGRYFAPPGLESVVVARDPADRPRLFEALRQLSAQDPLVDARLDGIDTELTVSLYGEVQKQVIAARLVSEFGVHADFLPTQTVYIERVSGRGEAFEQVSTGNASLGLRVEPGPVGSGLDYRLGVERGWLIPAFHTAVEETLALQLQAGLLGWRVTDCVVTLTQSRYSAPTPPAGYFRSLTATVVRRALAIGGTTVCAPISSFELEIPSATVSPVLQRLHATGAIPAPLEMRASRCRITGTIPTEQVHGFESRLPHLTSGEGVLFTEPAGYEPVQGTPPVRRSAQVHLNR